MMAKVTVELDEQTLQRLVEASRAAHVSVEDFLRRQAEQAFQAAAPELPGPSHRKALSALDRPEGYYETAREELHDRERDRAETYAETRNRLLSLIDNTTGDMGSQTWNRARLYES